MRLKSCIQVATLAGFMAMLSLGCDQGTTVQLEKVPPVQGGESKPVPTDVKKGGGPGSSGNIKQNPGANT